MPDAPTVASILRDVTDAVSRVRELERKFLAANRALVAAVNDGQRADALRDMAGASSIIGYAARRLHERCAAGSDALYDAAFAIDGMDSPVRCDGCERFVDESDAPAIRADSDESFRLCPACRAHR